MGGNGRVSLQKEKWGEGFDAPSPESRATVQHCALVVQIPDCGHILFALNL